MLSLNPLVPLLLLRALLLTVLSTLVVPLTAHQLATAGAFDIGSTVQLQGCVVEGERKGSFVFSRVTAFPVMPSPNGIYGPRHFWLADASQLVDHIGRTIQVTGTITEVRESEVERNPGLSSQDGERVAIELPIGDVITTVGLSGVGKDDRNSKVDMKITLLKVKVESLLVVMKTCLPTPGGPPR